MRYVYGFEVISYDVFSLIGRNFMNKVHKVVFFEAIVGVDFYVIIRVLMFWEGDFCVHMVVVYVHGGYSS